MDQYVSFHNLVKLQFKRRLRREMTPAERLLWEALRNRKLHGTKWRRQANVDVFIADFLCSEHQLIVEVDGVHHEDQQEYDRLRSDIIHDRGYRVIRFRNEEVLSALPSVLERISLAIGSPRRRSSLL